uniref:Uncharacterized protein n=1 Tax=Lepeophtheirus salmonis TaxID=72036 RepID=A0A0K2UDV5_LEPSM
MTTDEEKITFLFKLPIPKKTKTTCELKNTHDLHYYLNLLCSYCSYFLSKGIILFV